MKERNIENISIFKNLRAPFGTELVLYSVGFPRQDEKELLLHEGTCYLEKVRAIGIEFTDGAIVNPDPRLQTESYLTLSVNDKIMFETPSALIGTLNLPYMLAYKYLLIGSSGVLKATLSLQKPLSEYVADEYFVVQLGLWGSGPVKALAPMPPNSLVNYAKKLIARDLYQGKSGKARSERLF